MANLLVMLFILCYIVAKLRIADFLKDGPKGVNELAKETKTHPESLYRLLRMLSSIGIFAETKGRGEVEDQINQRRFELTPIPIKISLVT